VDPGGADEQMMAERNGRSAAPVVVGRVTKNAGHNRFVWDVQHESGLGAPPGAYQVRLTVEGRTFTQPLRVLIDPRIAAEGVTVADLREQFAHNTAMRDMTAEVQRLVARVNGAVTRLRAATGSAAADTLARLEVVAGKLNTEPVRYGKPGLQAHITYLAGMTRSVDMKVGRDAIARRGVLRRELDALVLEVNRLLGPAR
jgi:hypothetical protein